MQIAFLGTGAADWDWRNFPPGTLKSTCTLVGGSCLVDAGPCVLSALSDAGVPPARVSDLLLTHSHGDHFDPDSIRAIAGAGRRRLRVFAPPQALAALAGIRADLQPVLPGDSFEASGMRIAALPANHAVPERPDERPLHYFFASRGVRLLYALDGAWFECKARLALKRLLGGKPLSAIVWDATCGGSFRDFRFAEHNDLAMIDAMRASMLADGLVSPETVHCFDHVARTLWPSTPAARRRLAAKFRGILAEDGLSVRIGGAR